MPAFQVLTVAPPPRFIPVLQNGGHPHVEIVGEQGAGKSGHRLTVPIASPLQNSNLAARYETNDRALDYPTIHFAGNQLHQFSVEWDWVSRNPFLGFVEVVDGDIELDLQWLRYFGRSGERVQFRNYGPSTGGWWQCTELSWIDTRRQVGTNKISRATVSATWTKASDQNAVGPLTGGAQAAAAAFTYQASVKEGSSLVAVAHTAYGDGTMWRSIADANDVLPHLLTPTDVLNLTR